MVMRYWTKPLHRRRDKLKIKGSKWRTVPRSYVKFYHKSFRVKERLELREVLHGKEYDFIPEKHRNCAKWYWW